jgi:hypothetical protein
MKEWKPDKEIEGPFTVTRKIDGVQAQLYKGVWLSRADKPLYNLPVDLNDGIYEVYLGDWNSTVSAVRTINGDPIPKEALYQIYPYTDDRLYIFQGEKEESLPIDQVEELFKEEVGKGNEGLVIWTEKYPIKVKEKYTYDVEITGWVEGKGRNTGRLGAFQTAMGNIGTGFTDKDREKYKRNMIGMTIEVECMELTKAGKFRHPRFVRVRPDR